MSYDEYNDPRPDPIREGLGTLLKGLGWAAGLIGLGLAITLSNGVNPF
jgi:hypothetical protein